MKNKVVTYLKGLKKEQWIVYLLLAALLVVIAIPVNREGGESGSSGGEGSRTGQEAGESVGNDISGSSAETETAAGKEAQMAASLEEALAQVEGVGQFALRGGILDVYSPGMEQPVRAEFFGDELDAMGLFDPATQRRTENVERAVLLPAAEALPHLAPGGTAGLAARLEKLAAGAEKAGRHELVQTLRQDREALVQGRSFPATDRYLALIYPCR